MKYLILVAGYLCASLLASAGREKAEDLVAALEQSVGLAAHGDLGAAARAMNAEAKNQKSVQEVSAQADQFRDSYKKLSYLGESDGVERVSLAFTGDSFLRLRVVDKRADGVVLWTFVGYKFKNQWYCKGVIFNGGSDLMDLMKNLDPLMYVRSITDKMPVCIISNCKPHMMFIFDLLRR